MSGGVDLIHGTPSPVTATGNNNDAWPISINSIYHFVHYTAQAITSSINSIINTVKYRRRLHPITISWRYVGIPMWFTDEARVVNKQHACGMHVGWYGNDSGALHGRQHRGSTGDTRFVWYSSTSLGVITGHIYTHVATHPQSNKISIVVIIHLCESS